MDLQKELEQRFNNVYKGERTLYAIQLDGFTHRIFSKDNNGNYFIDYYTGCAPEQFDDYSDKVHSINLDKTKVIFIGCGHNSYQNNPTEFVYQPLSSW